MNPSRFCKTSSTHFHQERRESCIDISGYEEGNHTETEMTCFYRYMERRHWIVSDALCKLIVLHIDYQIQNFPTEVGFAPILLSRAGVGALIPVL